MFEDIYRRSPPSHFSNLISTRFQPLHNHVLCDFKVELKGVTHIADSHGLVWVILRID